MLALLMRGQGGGPFEGASVCPGSLADPRWDWLRFERINGLCVRMYGVVSVETRDL